MLETNRSSLLVFTICTKSREIEKCERKLHFPSFLSKATSSIRNKAQSNFCNIVYTVTTIMNVFDVQLMKIQLSNTTAILIHFFLLPVNIKFYFCCHLISPCIYSISNWRTLKHYFYLIYVASSLTW